MTLRVLVAHNAYQQPGGEDSVVEAEVALLRSRGNEVQTLTRHNDEIRGIPRIRLIRDAFWSRRTESEVAEIVRDFKPDVIHAHNTFPLISPSLYWAAAKHGIPVVQTLHNFRIFCLGAMFLRDSNVCEDCIGKLPWRGVVHKCYRNSVAQSSILAGALALHRSLGTWQKMVTRYIALSDFCREKVVAAGLPSNRVLVKPNFVDFAKPERKEQGSFLFVGRMSIEKGIEVLANAARQLNPIQLRVAGDGPMAEFFSGIPGVNRLGILSREKVRSEMCEAQALVVPSICYETFGMVVVEAYAAGLPVIASRIGALAEIVLHNKTGLLFEPGNSTDLANKLSWAREHPDEMRRMGKAARDVYEEHFSADANYKSLMAIYESAIREMHKGRAE